MMHPSTWQPYTCAGCGNKTRHAPSYVSGTNKTQISPSICLRCFPPTLEAEQAFYAPTALVPMDVREVAEKLHFVAPEIGTPAWDAWHRDSLRVLQQMQAERRYQIHRAQCPRCRNEHRRTRFA